MHTARIQANWQSVQGQIADAAQRSGRTPADVTVVGVTKRQPVAWVHALVDAGATALGENYPQELWEKAEALAGRSGIDWHLIGHLQTNKIRRTLPLARFVHAVDSARLLSTLDRFAGENPESLLQVCLQVNLSGESSKHGWAATDLDQLAQLLTQRQEQQAGVSVVGLMTIAGYGMTNAEAQPLFAQLRLLRDELQRRSGYPLPHLSMGMSGDFVAAVAEGATLVRIGSALFEGADQE